MQSSDSIHPRSSRERQESQMERDCKVQQTHISIIYCHFSFILSGNHIITREPQCEVYETALGLNSAERQTYFPVWDCAYTLPRERGRLVSSDNEIFVYARNKIKFDQFFLVYVLMHTKMMTRWRWMMVVELICGCMTRWRCGRAKVWMHDEVAMRQS